MLSIKTILHPTDFTGPSEVALSVAGALAADYGAQLVIVHVMSVPVVLGDGISWTAAEDFQGNLYRELEQLEVPDCGVEVVRRLEEGRPAAEILHVAQLCQADLIVMGTHGRRGLARFLMGSVAEEVMRQARCPVLTVGSTASPGALAGEIEDALHSEGVGVP